MTRSLFVGSRRLHLPPCDRLRRHPEHLRGLALRQAEKAPDPQDPESLLGWVMRTVALRHLVPACSEYSGRRTRHSEEQGTLSLRPFRTSSPPSYLSPAASRAPSRGRGRRG